MKAKCYLQQINRLDRQIENKMAEIERWWCIATGTTASGQTITINGEKHGIERVQSSGAGDKVGNAVCNMVDIEKECAADIDRLAKARLEIKLTIEQLKSTNECDVLYKRYVLQKSFKEIAADMGKSQSWATTVHGRALAEIQKILDEREKK